MKMIHLLLAGGALASLALLALPNQTPIAMEVVTPVAHVQPVLIEQPVEQPQMTLAEFNARPKPTNATALQIVQVAESFGVELPNWLKSSMELSM